MKTKQQCRHCNSRLAPDSGHCPVCQQSQSYLKEIIALVLAASIIAALAYLQLGHSPQRSDPTHADTPPPEREPAPRPDSPPLTPKRFPLHFKPVPTAQIPDSPGDPLSDPARRPPTAPAPQSIVYQGTRFRQSTGDYPFYTPETRWNAERQEYEFWRKGMHGSEVPLKVDVRRYFVSENQSQYPEPESGCGPTALLNLYIWYSKFGLLKESVHHSNPNTYKQLKFQQIDQKLLRIQRASRTRKGGTNTLAAIVAMDALVQEFSRDTLRLHFEIKQPPLKRHDFTRLSQGYRVGLLSVRPKDPHTGQLMDHHAVLAIRGDTAGMITLANWGDFSHGALVQRKDGQWFIPRDPSQHELKINHLSTLIPFVPHNP